MVGLRLNHCNSATIDYKFLFFAHWEESRWIVDADLRLLRLNAVDDIPIVYFIGESYDHPQKEAWLLPVRWRDAAALLHSGVTTYDSNDAWLRLPLFHCHPSRKLCDHPQSEAWFTSYGAP